MLQLAFEGMNLAGKRARGTKGVILPVEVGVVGVRDVVGGDGGVIEGLGGVAVAGGLLVGDGVPAQARGYVHIKWLPSTHYCQCLVRPNPTICPVHVPLTEPAG